MKPPAGRRLQRTLGARPTGRPTAAQQEPWERGRKERTPALSPRTKRRLYWLGAIALVLLLLHTLSAGALGGASSDQTPGPTGGGSQDPPAAIGGGPGDEPAQSSTPASPASPSPPGSTSTASKPPKTSSSYAIPLTELQGLPAQTEPGTHLDIWVAWNRPVTKGPRIQHLVSDVTVERILPPVSDGEPATVILSVADDSIPRLLYGDRWGALSATVTSDGKGG